MESFKLEYKYNYVEIRTFSKISVNCKNTNLSHISKCRELLYSYQKIIGYINPEYNDRTFTLVFKTVLFVDKIIKKLTNQNFKVSEKEVPTISDLQSAILYTIEVRMSPQWNKLGSAYIYGRDFLTEKSWLSSVEITIQIINGCLLTVDITPKSLFLPKLQLTDLAINSSIINELISSTCYTISNEEIPLKPAYVIPSLKMATVKQIFKGNLSNFSHFITFMDIQKHWKNQYGYRIPDEENPIYIQLLFQSKSPILFSYPLLCVLSDLPKFSTENYPEKIVNLFQQQFQQQFNSICGIPLTMTDECNTLSMKMRNYVFSDKIPININEKPDIQYNRFKKILGSFTSHNKKKLSLEIAFDDLSKENIINENRTESSIESTEIESVTSKIDSRKQEFSKINKNISNTHCNEIDSASIILHLPAKSKPIESLKKSKSEPIKTNKFIEINDCKKNGFLGEIIDDSLFDICDEKVISPVYKDSIYSTKSVTNSLNIDPLFSLSSNRLITINLNNENNQMESEKTNANGILSFGTSSIYDSQTVNQNTISNNDHLSSSTINCDNASYNSDHNQLDIPCNKSKRRLGLARSHLRKVSVC